MYRLSDGLYDQAEVAAFGLDLEAQLQSIHTAFRSGRFRMAPIRLLPQPKKPDADGKPRMRQSFQVAVRDQVAWIAMINAIGPELDMRMPPWSYGHRLYRAAWYEEGTDDRSFLCIGPYRHSTGHLYRRFMHSWPRYRRHVVLTARFMGFGEHPSPNELEEGERRSLEEQLRAQEVSADDRLPYLEQEFWSGEAGSKKYIYYAGFDLTKFYPKVSTRVILRNFDRYVENLSVDHIARNLLERLLDFRVDVAQLTPEIRDASDPPVGQGKFRGIPTGLMVAGFLSNVAMLLVDHAVMEKTKSSQVAHFRFVDDHVVLAFEFDALCNWIEEYSDLLNKYGIDSGINEDKYDPKGLEKYVSVLSKKESPVSEPGSVSKDEMAKKCRIDPENPTPLMTVTLAQISTLASVDFDALTELELAECLEDLKRLLLSDMPQTEIREEMRVAFAAARIALLAPRAVTVSDDLVILERQLARNKETTDLNQQIKHARSELEKDRNRNRKHYFDLLYQAFIQHPEKIRLFLHLLKYCQTTGYPGLSKISQWLTERIDSEVAPLCHYLGALAFQATSVQVVKAAVDSIDPDILHRQREAAREYLGHFATFEPTAFLPINETISENLNFFETQAINSMRVGVTAAIDILANAEPGTSVSSLVKCLKDLARRVQSLSWADGTENWYEVVGRSLGVWVHWAENISTDVWTSNPGPVWRSAVSHLDAKDRND